MPDPQRYTASLDRDAGLLVGRFVLLREAAPHRQAAADFLVSERDRSAAIPYVIRLPALGSESTATSS